MRLLSFSMVIPLLALGSVRADDDLGKLITPAALKKKLAGKAVFNAKTGELTLTYDLSNKDQLKDFEADPRPTVAKGVLTLEPGTGVQHVVKFRSLKLTGVASVGKPMGDHLETTGGVKVVGGGTLLTGVGRDKYAECGFTANRTNMAFELVVSDKRVAVAFGAKKGGVAVDGTGLGGHVKLGGGAGGNQFSKLVVSGVVDADWAKDFFKE